MPKKDNPKIKKSQLERDLEQHLEASKDAQIAHINHLLIALLQQSEASRKNVVISSYPACNSEA